MKPQDSFSEIGELLRSHKPDPQIPAGLEPRILRSLALPKQNPAARFPTWLLFPPAAAFIAFLLWPNPAVIPSSSPGIAQKNPPFLPLERALDPPFEIANVNPLKTETAALQRDAARAGNFLIHSLPSFSLPEN